MAVTLGYEGISLRGKDLLCWFGRAPSGGFLIQADHVSCRVAEPRRDLGCVHADRLRDLSPIGDDHFKGRGHAVHHDVNEKAGL